MMNLHYATGTVSVAAAIALVESGLPHQLTAVDFKSAAQTKPAFLALNPKGRVPVLVTDQGVLSETGAILDYIGTLCPVLVPDDAFQAGKMREAMYYLAATMHVAHAHKMRGSRWADQQSSFDDMRAKVPQTVGDCCAYLESTYDFAPFVLGSDLTLVDGYMFIVLSWVQGDGVDVAAYPKISAFLDMMRARPSVQSLTAKGVIG